MSTNAEAARALVEALIAGGAAHAVVSPGSRSAPLALALDAAEREGRIAVHVLLDERAAAFFALGAARASGRPAVVLATSGSAGAHGLPAAIEASESGVPMIFVTADRPPELHGVGAPQTTPQRALFGVHARAQLTLPVPGEATSARVFSSFGARAIERATAPKPGPVHLDAPFREPLWDPSELAASAPPAPRLWSGARRLAPEDADELSRALVPRGLIVAGPLEGALPASLRLAERLGWPVLADAASNLRARGHASVITRGDAIARASVPALAPELVLRVGRAPSSRALHDWLERVARDRVIVVDAGGELLDPSRLARGLVAADPETTFDALLSRPLPAPDPSWLAAWQRAEGAAAEVLDADSPRLWEGEVARVVARTLAPETILHVGSGMPVRDLDACGGAIAAGARVYASRGANGIDGAIATALGELTGSGARRGIALLGDLTTLHDLGSLRLARDRALTLVVVDNGGGGVFDFLPIAGHPTAFSRLFRAPEALDLEGVARAMGLGARVAQDRGALEAALEAPGLVRVPVDPTFNVETHRARWAESAARVVRALAERSAA